VNGEFAAAGSVLRIGVLTPHTTIGPEVEIPAMAPGRAFTRVARLSARAAPVGGDADATTAHGLEDLTAASDLEEAVDILRLAAVDVIGYASTSSAYEIGFEAEAAVVSGLSERVGVPVAATCASCAMALRVLGVERVALVHPPWFDIALNHLGGVYFEGQGFDVVSSASAALPRDPRRIEPAGVYEWTSRHVADDAEAVFIGGNGFRAAGAIAGLEDLLDRPVLTANQVLLWDLLRRADDAYQVTGYGRLFALDNGSPILDGAGPTVSSKRSGTS
jgi:maleate isomerase